MRPLFIFGASRGVGLEVARLERACHRQVIAFVRPHSETEELVRIGATVVEGDALSKTDVTLALPKKGVEFDIVSTLGGQSKDGRRADDEGNINVIDAAVKNDGAGRFLLVTSIGCGETAPFRSQRAIDAFGAAVDAKTRAEERLKASTLEWTILRPGGLKSEPATGQGILSQDPEIHGLIHRADMALLVSRSLRDASTLKHAFAAVDAQLARCVNPIQPFQLAQLEQLS